MREVDPLRQASVLLEGVREAPLTDQIREEKAVELATHLLQASQLELTPQEKRRQKLLFRLMEDPPGKAFTAQMTDLCFRSESPKRIIEEWRYLTNSFGIPKYLSFGWKLAFMVLRGLSHISYSLSAKLIQKGLQRECTSIVIPAEERILSDHLRERHQSGVRVNLNYLGEAILGEYEARQRLEYYLKALSNPDIECISVKISTLSSQIHPLAWEETLERLAIPLRKLYSAAQNNLFHHNNGTSTPKLVNLDMEEYRDLELTVALFKKVLSEPSFLNYSAGIALQSYLPDSFNVQRQLIEWSRQRCQNGGVPIKIRLVKGANRAMEKIESSIKGWPLATYSNKWETDANFKRMLLLASSPANAPFIQISIASHNILDIAYAMVLRSELKLEGNITFEMLEGMTPHLQRIIHKIAGPLLVYSPTVSAKSFHTAIAYLFRRLDENTEPENFLRSIFGLTVGSDCWNEQVEYFKTACNGLYEVSTTPYRQQDRSREVALIIPLESPFANEADTDWSLRHNHLWIQELLDGWQAPIEPIQLSLPENDEDRGFDPSQPSSPLYRYFKGNANTANHLVAIAKSTPKTQNAETRAELLGKAASLLRISRGDLICAMVANVGKNVSEADGEVSEAIDFCEYYRRSLLEFHSLQDIAWDPLGTIVIASPWNFPCSISVGGIAAALACGNSVIYKPAQESLLVGSLIAKIFWSAGFSHEELQLTTGDDKTLGSALVTHHDVDAIILTGATATASHLLNLRPGLNLIAETGGKNSIIVTEMADKDLAIRSIIQSAFSYSGQKCSAASLLICLPEVYESEQFRQQLRDAAASLPVGSAWNHSSMITPLIRIPGPDLLKSLQQLETGEEWLLKPTCNAKNRQLWSPGIKMGVTTQSFSYSRELFGPLLSVMRADNLAHAVELANGTPYGLTAGIQTLDLREQRYWLQHIRAGNCYINRSITGAIVQRQPFGGCKKSQFGAGAKAGGPNYLTQLMRPKQNTLPREQIAPKQPVLALDSYVKTLKITEEERSLWTASLASYSFFWSYYFQRDHNPNPCLGEDNILRYLPREAALLRIQKNDSKWDIFRAAAAALITGSSLTISCSQQFPEQKDLLQVSLGRVQITYDSTEEFYLRVRELQLNTVRYTTPPTIDEATSLSVLSCSCLVAPILANGRLELLHHLREVTISHSYHRYGHTIGRGEEHDSEGGQLAGCCFGRGTPMGCCGNGECDQM